MSMAQPIRHLARGFFLALLMIGAAQAQRATDPRGAAAAQQIARCDAAAAHLAKEHVRDMHVAFRQALPFAQDILASHQVKASFTDGGRQARVELHLRHVRDLEIPEGSPSTHDIPGVDGAAILQDRRSRHPALWQVDEATVAAADRAYDIRYRDPADPNSRPWLEDSPTAAALAQYEVVRVYTDRYSGFAGLVLEAKDRRHPHRIYAIAGTHTFDHPDLRTWASGLTMGRAQAISTAALSMIRDAAAYATAGPAGGEVFVTGQSQGGLSAQGVGYVLQAYLDAVQKPHHLVHIVSWGAIGAKDSLIRMIAHWREGKGRGFAAELERHWAASDPNYPAAAEVWNAVATRWARVAPGREAAHLDDTATRMRSIGYFFEVDLFARAGTFLGTTFAFPTALILPDECETTVAESMVGFGSGGFGVRLESHFLKGYRRAVARGAIAVARPAQAAKWEWMTNLLPTFESVGEVWLEMIYLNRDATLDPNWAVCTANAEWFTAENRSCRSAGWDGCGPSSDPPRWCLVREPPPGVSLPAIR